MLSNWNILRSVWLQVRIEFNIKFSLKIHYSLNLSLLPSAPLSLPWCCLQIQASYGILQSSRYSHNESKMATDASHFHITPWGRKKACLWQLLYLRRSFSYWSKWDQLFILFFFKDFIYSFLERREEERGREISMCGCLLCTPKWRSGPQPGHVPWLGMELVTLWLAAWAQSTELHQSGPMVHSWINHYEQVERLCWLAHVYQVQPLELCSYA